MTETVRVKPTKFFIDFENVHGAGLKGIDALGEHDEVLIFYSQAAETFHIEHAIDILKSKARVQFVEIDGGTRNAADFQLIVALFGDMDEAFDYAIVSGDTGFDAAIRMGERMGKPAVRRLGNIQGDEAEPEKPKSRRSRRSRSSRDAAKDAVETADGTEAAPEKPETEETTGSDKAPEGTTAEAEAAPDVETTADQPEEQALEQSDEQKPSPSRRRPRRRKRNGNQPEEQIGAQGEAGQAEGASPNGNSATDEAATLADGGSEASEKPQREPDHAEKEPPKTAGAKKPRRSTSKRVSTRQETDAAYARAAEAMRLALAEEAVGEASPTGDESPASAATDTPDPEAASSKASASEETDAATLVKALLGEKGVTLTDKQAATVASALDGSGGRQGFYRRIIKIERQQNGRALYRLVREHYNALVEALNA